MAFLLCLLRAAAGSAGVQDFNHRFQDEQERFQLFNDCRPMSVFASLDDEQGGAPSGLSTARLQAAAARLYEDDMVEAGFSSLTAGITVVGAAFAVQVIYTKLTEDAYGNAGFAMTWTKETVGTHGQDSTYIMGAVTAGLDAFLAGYLRINEAACDARFGH